MPRPSSAVITSTTPFLKLTASPSIRTPSHNVLSRSQTTHFMSFLSNAVFVFIIDFQVSSVAVRMIPCLLLIAIIGNQYLLNLVAAFDDLHYLGVAHVSLNGILIPAAIRPVNLHRVARGFHSRSRSEIFGYQRFHHLAGVADLFQRSGSAAQQAGRIYVYNHL